MSAGDVPQLSERPLRLFVALELPPEIRSAIAETQQSVRCLLGHDARWTPPEQFHVTLKFLGGINPAVIERLVVALSAVAKQFFPLPLTVAGLGAFLQRRQPRVLWAGVNDSSGQLLRLHRCIEAAAAPFTAEAPDARFSAHVTFARVKEITGHTALKQLLAQSNQKPFGSWTAMGVELMRSQLSPSGAQHFPVAEIPFGGAPPKHQDPTSKHQ